MNLRSLFGRKQNRFYDLLTQQAEKTLRGMEALLAAEDVRKNYLEV